MDNEREKEIGARAKESFKSGLYCAESVVSALMKMQGIESELFPKAATAFCSGMSRTCGTCGALTGAIMGISMAHGRSSAEESVDRAYASTQQLISEFEKHFGAKNCHELLECDLGTEQGKKKFKDDHLRQNCEEYTRVATEIAVRLILNR